MRTKSVLFRGVYGLALMASVSMVLAQPMGTRPAAEPDPHFARATKMLEQGGARFTYVNVEGVLEKILDFSTSLARLIPEPGAPAVVGGVVGGIKELGLTDIVALGGSRVRIAGGGSRSISVLDMKTRTGIFALLDEAATEPALLKAIPSDVYGFTILRIKFSDILKLVNGIAKRAAGTIGQQAVADVVRKMKENDEIDVEAVLADIDSEFAFVNVIVPGDEAGGKSTVVLLRMKSDATFNFLKTRIEKRDNVTFKPTEVGAWTSLDLSEAKGKGLLAYHPTEKVIAYALDAAALQAVDAAIKDASKRVTNNEEFKKWGAGLDTRSAGVAFNSSRGKEPAMRLLETLLRKEQELKGLPQILEPLITQFTAPYVTVVRVADAQIITESQGASTAIADAPGLLGVAAVGVLAAIAVPNFLEAQVRAKVSRSRSDMRSLATGIESWYVDNSQYPQSATDPKNAIAHLQTPDGKAVPTFALSQADRKPSPWHITTPISYLTSYFPDPFNTKDSDGNTFGYFTTRLETGDRGWIVFSVGPDGKFDLDWTKYDPKKGIEQTDLYNDTYDPTNGTVSHGDIWRVKQ